MSSSSSSDGGQGDAPPPEADGDDTLGPARDYAALGARILNPDQPRLEQAAAAVEGIDDPAEAWETLATRGVIPEGWATGQASRRFRPAAGGGLAHPPTVDACVAFAADPAGVEAAEALAVEVLLRFEPFGRTPSTSRLEWRADGTRGDGMLNPLLSPALLATAYDAGQLVAGVLPSEVSIACARMTFPVLTSSGYPATFAQQSSGRSGPGNWFAMQVQHAAFYGECWRRALLLSKPRRKLVTPGGVALASLRNPFEPLLDLYATGYLVGAGPRPEPAAAGAQLVLVAPALEQPALPPPLPPRSKRTREAAGTP